MTIATKGKRNISVGNRDFFWYVSDDYDSAFMVLRVASPDKRFVVNYHIGQPDAACHLIVLGKEFDGLAETKRGWRRVLCPRWEEDRAIKPAAVRRLIAWCVNENIELVEVDWTGAPINHG